MTRIIHHLLLGAAPVALPGLGLFRVRRATLERATYDLDRAQTVWVPSGLTVTELLRAAAREGET